MLYPADVELKAKDFLPKKVYFFAVITACPYLLSFTLFLK